MSMFYEASPFRRTTSKSIGTDPHPIPTGSPDLISWPMDSPGGNIDGDVVGS